MILETERLILRPLVETDAESIFEYAKDPEVGPVAGWPAHQSVQESRDVIREVLSGPRCYGLCLKSDNRAIGAIELILNGHTALTYRDDECELGYWIGKPFWGNGYMPEAGKCLIQYGFEKLGMRRIWCSYFDGNEKSKRVQEKCGFIYNKTRENLEVPLLNEVRTSHTNVLTKERWCELHNKSKMYEFKKV